MRNYSLGMRQRLGIAHALLGDPSVLILDEPANGLDPAGIRWMRGLLKGYADRGGTVLLSSHLLHEVEQIADEMILIGRGRIVAQRHQGRAARRRRRRRPRSVTALDNERLAEALERQGPHRRAGRRRAAGRGRAGRRRPRRRRERRSSSPTCAPAEGGLEDLFLELTADTQRDDLGPHAGAAGMSTATVRPRPSTSPAPRRSRSAGWCAVELRKMADTRAGRWLLISIAALTALVLIIQLAVVLGQDLDVDVPRLPAGA